jgi:hypothetical protein
MKFAYFVIHPGKNHPPQNKKVSKKKKKKTHRFHILHFPNSTGLFTKPSGCPWTLAAREKEGRKKGRGVEGSAGGQAGTQAGRQPTCSSAWTAAAPGLRLLWLGKGCSVKFA